MALPTLIDAVAANIPDFDLRVVNTTDTLEYDTDNNDIPFGQISANIAGTPVTPDGVWLRVSHAPAISEPYRLYAVVQPPSSSAALEIEPNSTQAQAQSSSKNYFAGYLPGPTDEDYYAFTIANSEVINGLHVANTSALVCLKAKAYLDLTERKAQGAQIDDQKIKKHRNDIVRLIATLPDKGLPSPPASIQEDLQRYIALLTEENPDMSAVIKSAGLGRTTLVEILQTMKRLYSLA